MFLVRINNLSSLDGSGDSPMPSSTTGPCCKALYNYEAKVDDELGFKEGDLITLKRRDKRRDENWYYGMIDEKSGYIPINYVTIVVNPTSNICSFAKLGKIPLKDDYYQCLTCNMASGLITDSYICSRCIKFCHADHNVQYAGGNDSHFCDCGAKGAEICLSLQSGKFDLKKVLLAWFF